MGLLFYPRGGSSQVVRYLVPALAAAGWPVALVAGSLGAPGDRRHAESFFKHALLTPVAYDDAVRAHAEGRDPHSEPVPMHPSFEDRPGAPDRVFASLAPERRRPHRAGLDGASSPARGRRRPRSCTSTT